MKIISDDYRVRKGVTVNLQKRPTLIKALYKSKQDYEKRLQDNIERLSDQQERLYASNRYALLLIFQAMDAAGKDSTIKAVMSGINPQGCQVTSFKHPTPVELEHDFLWRTTQKLPARGMIGIFNRSYYEDVLIVRVHPEILLGQNVPGVPADHSSIWKQRYRSINQAEAHLERNGTRIMKFFLHVSKEEQRKRFLDRIDTPKKNWKFNQGDIQERQYWNHYRRAYEKCLNATSTAVAPWHVIPADDKNTMRLIVSQLIADKLQEMDLNFPVLSQQEQQKLQLMREQLVNEKRDDHNGSSAKNTQRAIS